MEKQIGLARTQKEEYDFIEFESKIRDEVTNILKYEEKKLDPIKEKMEKVREDVQRCYGEIEQQTLTLRQANVDATKRDDRIRLEVAEEVRQLNLSCKHYDDKI